MTQHAFQTEVTQLLNLMIHSLYSNKEIFLRELISNASDACDKLRFQSLTNAALTAGDSDLRVEVGADSEARTITLTDNGVGLTEAEAIEHLGTIAKSGTKAFLQAAKDKQQGTADLNLIGQFGVGFYSAFMVADKVVVESRSAHASAADGVRWESAGDGTYATERIERPRRGTTITLHLREDAGEFADTWRLRQLIKQYSDYVAYPVMLPKHQSDEDKKANKPVEQEQVNAGKALWTRPKDQITAEQYTEFYRAACKQWDEPGTRLHFTVEGTLSFTALLFIPGSKPMDLFDRDKRGLSLYVRRVFIMDDCKDLLPEWLRCVKGVVDSDDLPLNVSREILQDNEVVKKLRKQLVKKLLDHLQAIATSNEQADKDAFAKVDAAFGPTLREGLVNDFEHKERIARIVRYKSTWTETPAAEGAEAKPATTGLEDYVRRMPEGQKAIYVITAPSLAVAKASPQIEGFTAKGFEVLYMTDPVDEWVAQHFTEFDGRKIVSVAKGADDLADDAGKKDIEEKTKTYAPFLGFCKETLGDGIKEVRLSARLADSPCCLVGEEHGMTAQMEEMLKRMGQDVPASGRILELNPKHPLIERLQGMFGSAPAEQMKAYVETLRDQAAIAEGGRVADAAAFAKRVQTLLMGAVAK
jgi:molecular chaperone HtpG